jgi:azobenzene reductase
MNVLFFNGSPAKPSHTSATLLELSKLFEEAGNICETVNLLDFGIPINDPIYHADAMQSPDEKVKLLSTKVKAAEIIILGTPLYHGSYSGLLKTALDNLDGDAFNGKIVLIVSNASGMRGSMVAAQHLVVVPRTMGGNVYDRLIGTCKADFISQGDTFVLKSDEILDRCKAVAAEIINIKVK